MKTKFKNLFVTAFMLAAAFTPSYAVDITVTIPEDAEMQIGSKKAHYIDFITIEPAATEIKDGNKVLKFQLKENSTFNYRTWKEGGLTYAGYFTAGSDPEKLPDLTFTPEMYISHDPKDINHDVASNQGYETGDIFVNVNERGYKDMNVGDVFRAHAMRTWELTDNSTNNYFIEPDFHYTVLDSDGNPSSGVISIEQKPGSAWADIKAIGNGTAIVLVTYDAINLNIFDRNGVKGNYMGGEFWGAIWPENTAVYVITVGEGESATRPEMTINENYNIDTKKNAGKYVDAEHDVFYYLEGTDGYKYTFTGENIDKISIAYPTIGEHMATYTGFGNEGVTVNGDGTYSILLKEGRQIIRFTDAAGKSTYQVLTAKKCTREITNASRPGSKIFQPGDEIKIQYSGLRHPANKLAGIYNMSAYVTYNGTPNGTSLILGRGQYTFGSTPSAQAVTIKVPADHDTEADPSLNLTEGVIQVNGYGDPIGNHRLIDPEVGRNPNFNAIAHKTYFGAIPDISIPLSAVRLFDINFTCNVEDAEIELSLNGNVLQPDDNGIYSGTYGTYAVTAKKAGYRCFRNDFTLGDDAGDEMHTIDITMTEAPGAWDGTTVTEPVLNEDGFYVIDTPADMAWYAAHINSGNTSSKARLDNDIDLGDYDWTPIGSTRNYFAGTFNGCGHKVTGLYVNSSSNNSGLFGAVRGTKEVPAAITGVTVDGVVKGTGYVGGIAGYLNAYASIDTCANYASVSGSDNFVGGIVGRTYLESTKISNCYNAGTISSPGYHAGISGGFMNTYDYINNVFNIGEIEENDNASAVTGSGNTKNNTTNAFAIKDYAITGGYTLVTDIQMASGEIAYRLGDAFGQRIGENSHPVFNGDKVYKVTYSIVGNNDDSSVSEYELYSNAELPASIDGQIVRWYSDEAMTQQVSSIDSDSRLYLKNIYKYVLTYLLDEEPYKEEAILEGETIVPEADPVKEGHSFSGWKDLPAVMPAHDVTVTGSFSVNSYKLTLFLNNEIYKENMVEYGTPIVIEDPEIPENYKFDGWTDEIPETMPAHDVDIHGSYSLTTGVDDILIDNNAKTVICTPDGTVIFTDKPWEEVKHNLAPGVYIARIGDTVTKTYIK